jgi:hypothetical protein
MALNEPITMQEFINNNYPKEDEEEEEGWWPQTHCSW